MNAPVNPGVQAGHAAWIRGRVVALSHARRTPHLGSSLSCVDLLTAAYWGGLRLDPAQPDDPGRDRLILSKGHAAAALYAALCRRGYFPEALLETYCRPGSALQEHPGPRCAPGVEAATGSLGHGLALGCGMALAAQLREQPWRVAVILSDGECNEGTTWESALFAAAQPLGNLLALVDYNKWQATGRSNEVLALAPLREKWAAFGWDARACDGHDLEALNEVFAEPWDPAGAPRLVVCHTIKGRGVSFMEDDNNWHYRIPTADEVAAARQELGLS
ncbi:MAG: transketolase [Candidatus Marinimicrobia bacterium]|nr:transketolase [Candidatus Neomarinimicrobiota bacterium]